MFTNVVLNVKESVVFYMWFSAPPLPTNEAYTLDETKSKELLPEPNIKGTPT
jgi:hypothetical protein